jgi:hypothetical protein
MEQFLIFGGERGITRNLVIKLMHKVLKFF